DGNALSCFLCRSDDGASDGIYQVDFLLLERPGCIGRQLRITPGVSDRQSELLAFLEADFVWPFSQSVNRLRHRPARKENTDAVDFLLRVGGRAKRQKHCA